jgi:uncharacterized membrane protein
MITFSNTIAIDRPVPDVFAYLSDLENVPEWNWAIDDTTQTTPGDPGVGTRYRQTRSTPRPVTEELEIVTLEEDDRLEVVGTLAEIPVRLTYLVDRTEAGTHLTNRVDLEPRGGMRLVARLASGQIERAVAENLGQLKSRLERA